MTVDTRRRRIRRPVRPPASSGSSRRAAPAAPAAGDRVRAAPGQNAEMNAWLFMRISGIALVVLVLGHLLIMTMLNGGLRAGQLRLRRRRWSSPFWRLWDLLMLWLAELHGTLGLRTVINDYAGARRPGCG